MFKFLRSQAKVFYWVIAGTFVLFLFLGGMTGRGCQAPGSKSIEPGVMGSVNGDKITSQQYDFAVRQQISQMKQQLGDQELTANHYAAADEQAWNALVRNLLIEQAIAERKIKVDDGEVLAVFQNNPPFEILNQFRDEDGQVDMDAYYAALQNPENDWSSAENYVRNMLPRQKLNDEIAASAVVDEGEVREEYVRQTGRAVAEYVGALFSDLPQDYEPSESEVSAWYDAHPEDYQAEEQAQVKVVRFAKKPSAADEAEVLADMNAIREEILSGAKDFAVAVAEYSEDDNSIIHGGDLGHFDRTRMGERFTKVAFDLPIGELSEPVRTKFGYHLIEVTDRDVDQETGEAYEISARHILLRVTPGPDTLDLLRDAADDFRNRVSGETFASTAEAEALELQSPAPFTKGRDIPSILLSLRGSNWAFAAKPGEVSPVFDNSDAFYVVLAESRIPAGLRPLADVRGQVTLALRREHNLEVAKAKLGPAVGELQMGKAMTEVAAANGLAHAVTDTFSANGNVEGVGYGTDFNLQVIKGAVGTLIPEIETLRGVFAAQPLWITPLDEDDYNQRRANIQAALLQRAQGEVIKNWFDERMAAADIVDYRHQLRQGS